MRSEEELVDPYVTNTQSNIFALKSLPEVVKGALFSRYSRTKLGLKELLAKEFLEKEGDAILDNEEKAVQFYDRILDGYGDDSVAELGGAHLALEEVSMLAAKIIEDARIGGSPLEKSTRYVSFDQKIDGAFRYYRDAKLMNSRYREEYTALCDFLFETYQTLIPKMIEKIAALNPKEASSSESAYKTAVRSMAFDCLRGLLPAATLTNMGCFGNGRFFEGLLTKLQASKLTEMKTIGKQAHEELSKIIPSFVKRAFSEHRHFASMALYLNEIDAVLNKAKERVYPFKKGEKKEKGDLEVFLVRAPEQSEIHHLVASLIYEKSDHDYQSILQQVEQLDNESIEEILSALSTPRKNRRHKSPRALEHLNYTFDVIVDFGTYRDLQRHRMMTQHRQLFTCDLGYHIPSELLGGEEEVLYRGAMERAKQVYQKIANDFPEEAQYIVPMAYNIRWSIRINLRALQWLTEIRSTPQGHPQYRKVAQMMAKEVIKVHPSFKSFFKFVDFNEHQIGRLAQEEKTLQKKAELVDASRTC